jgi:hypothetical protein
MPTRWAAEVAEAEVEFCESSAGDGVLGLQRTQQLPVLARLPVQQLARAALEEEEAE